MNIRDNQVLVAKQQVCQALGDNYKTYLANMKLWFRKIWTKEQFDAECRKLFTSKQRHLHNQFFLAILNKITAPMHPKTATINITKHSDLSKSSSSNSSSKKRKRTSTRTERTKFDPVELYDVLPDQSKDYLTRLPSTPFLEVRYAAQELFLVDNALVMGRMLVSAWENGLVTADDRVSDYIVQASNLLMKNILTAIVKTRKFYRTTPGSRFSYDFGAAVRDPAQRNTSARKIVDDYPMEIDKEIVSTNLMRRYNDDIAFVASCEDVHVKAVKPKIHLIDLFRALQDRNLIPCHSVYSINIERIAHMLN